MPSQTDLCLGFSEHLGLFLPHQNRLAQLKGIIYMTYCKIALKICFPFFAIKYQIVEENII